MKQYFKINFIDLLVLLTTFEVTFAKFYLQSSPLIVFMEVLIFPQWVEQGSLSNQPGSEHFPLLRLLIFYPFSREKAFLLNE